MIDLTFGLFSLFSNPYRTCRKFLQKKGETDVYAYGETPFSTLQKIASQCNASRSDRWLELGSGRGRGCFWIAQFIGCETVGVEWIPPFVRLSRFLKNLFGVQNVSFLHQNFEEADFSGVSIVYLYGTCLPDETVSRLTEKMEALPNGARVVSISEPLECGHLRMIKSFPVRYPWGEAEAFLHHKI